MEQDKYDDICKYIMECVLINNLYNQSTFHKILYKKERTRIDFTQKNICYI